MLRGNFIALYVYFREGFKNNDLVSTKKFLEKVELAKTKIKVEKVEQTKPKERKKEQKPMK